MMHWKELGTQGRIDAIRAVWVPGCSTRQIAAHFKDATRNAIIGIYNRYGDTHLVDKPLRSKLAIGAERKSRKRPEPGTSLFKVRTSKPLPRATEEAGEAQLCGKPMMMLQAKECRWTVNDASPDELNLFCGRPSEASYCSHHVRRAYLVRQAR